MSERKMAEGRIEIPRADGTAVTVELKARGVAIGEWNRPGEEGTCSGYTLSREWPGTKTDFALAEELLRVAHERARLLADAESREENARQFGQKKAREGAIKLAEEMLREEWNYDSKLSLREYVRRLWESAP